MKADNIKNIIVKLKGEISGTSKWCHLRYNESLRTAVKIRIKNYNATKLCEECGIHRNNFYKWMSGENPKRVNQWQLIRLCGKMGIKVSLKIDIE